MTKMEREKLIEAARVLKENCENDEYGLCKIEKVNCPFQIGTGKYGRYGCLIEYGRIPNNWELPEVQDKEDKNK